MLTWQFARFNDLPIVDWYQASAARIAVFVVEQQCQFQDLDNADFQSWHLLGWDYSAGEKKLAAYCRIVDAGIKFSTPSIGRVITTTHYRRGGFGKQLMHEACRRHDTLYPTLANRIGAQARLEKFYAAFGYVVDSAPYLEDGIDHVEMQRAK